MDTSRRACIPYKYLQILADRGGCLYGPRDYVPDVANDIAHCRHLLRSLCDEDFELMR